MTYLETKIASLLQQELNLKFALCQDADDATDVTFQHIFTNWRGCALLNVIPFNNNRGRKAEYTLNLFHMLPTDKSNLRNIPSTELRILLDKQLRLLPKMENVTRKRQLHREPPLSVQYESKMMKSNSGFEYEAFRSKDRCDEPCLFSM